MEILWAAVAGVVVLVVVLVLGLLTFAPPDRDRLDKE